MECNEEVNSADKLRDATTALEPDARARTTGAIRADGTVSMVTLEEWHAAVSGFALTLAVPLDIRVHFETAKNLYLYAWFVYRFYPVAEQQALATLEFALRERLARKRADYRASMEHIREMEARGLSEMWFDDSAIELMLPPKNVLHS
ncbi:MAG TPA: hypothetical protein VIK56_14510 [Rhodoferax sp.]